MAKRIASAAVGIPIFLYLLYLGDVPLALLFWVLGIIGLWEMASLLNMRARSLVFINVLAHTAIVIMAHKGQVRYLSIGLGLLAIAYLALAVLSSIVQGRSASGSGCVVQQFKDILSNCTVSYFAVVYIGWMGAHLLLLRDMKQNGFWWALAAVMAVWASDSGAYFVGTKFSWLKFAGPLSPNKSASGAAGALLATVATLFAVSWWFPISLSLLAAVVLALLTSVAVQMGDLWVSLLKRSCQRKDTGTIIPGHGGVLDRFDGFFVAMPVFLYTLEALRWLGLT